LVSHIGEQIPSRSRKDLFLCYPETNNFRLYFLTNPSGRVQMSDYLDSDLDKENTLLELYKIYHDRLRHEYDLSWEQVKVCMYITGVIIGGFGLLLKEKSKYPGIEVLVNLIPIIGLFIGLASLMILIGSLKTSEEIRNDLSSIETKIKISPDVMRYTDFQNTYSTFLGANFDYITAGKVLLHLIVIFFWLTTLFLVA
jgi:hypothetical protein